MLPLLVAGWLAFCRSTRCTKTHVPAAAHPFGSGVFLDGDLSHASCCQGTQRGPSCCWQRCPDHADPSEWRWCRLPVANRSIGSAAQT